MTATMLDAAPGIETIRGQIAFYEAEVRRHPLHRIIRGPGLPARIETDFARYLFTDSWMWPPMLISMRDHAEHPKLRRAIEDNLQDESGRRGASHVKLCMRFLRSLGIVPALTDMPELNRTVNISGSLSEAQTAGWLAAAETLTLPLYEMALACFAGKPGVDTAYLDVHMAVDKDHISWLWTAVEAIVAAGAGPEEVMQGAALGARATLKTLDQFFEEAVGEEGLSQREARLPGEGQDRLPFGRGHRLDR